jgi:hypothetical protein
MVSFFIKELLGSKRPLFFQFITENVLRFLFRSLVIFGVDPIEIIFAGIDNVWLIYIFLLTLLVQVADMKGFNMLCFFHFLEAIVITVELLDLPLELFYF